MDQLRPEQRSRLMSRVRGKDTAPELSVRAALRKLGIRYRLHAKELPGKPDIVNRKRRWAIFVHGCFWHGHRCGRGRLPTTNVEFWKAKIAANQERDRSAISKLRERGWITLVVWECQLKDRANVTGRLQRLTSEIAPNGHRTTKARRDARRRGVRCKL